jgi:hypothetical protein
MGGYSYSWISYSCGGGKWGDIPGGGVLAGGGGAALASGNTDVLSISMRMEARRACGWHARMSYARNWVGEVDWYIDNMCAINNYRRMRRWVANDWSKRLAIEMQMDTSMCSVGESKPSGRCITSMWRSARSASGKPLGR